MLGKQRLTDRNYTNRLEIWLTETNIYLKILIHFEEFAIYFGAQDFIFCRIGYEKIIAVKTVCGDKFSFE